MTILLVDDEEEVVRVTSDFLEDCGYHVISAGDGAMALRVLEERDDIGLVVSDIRMPRMDGIDFLKAVRIRFPGIPVILITGHGDEEIAIQALQQGAFDYLKKPVRFTDLQACVERAEARSRLEANLLREYQDSLRGPSAPEQNAAPSVADPGRQALLASALTDLQGLETFWFAVVDWIEPPPVQDPERRDQIDFVRREMPGLLADLRRRIEMLGGHAFHGSKPASREGMPHDPLASSPTREAIGILDSQGAKV